jgi:hypothetical protein
MVLIKQKSEKERHGGYEVAIELAENSLQLYILTTVAYRLEQGWPEFVQTQECNNMQGKFASLLY